jgi:hypothetical protein
MFLFNAKTAWNDYFPGISPSQTYGPKLFTSTIFPSGPNVYVLNCLFISCSSSNSGGAISSETVKYLLIESSSFFSCRTSNINGGAIYIYSTNSNECILYKVCGYDCCSTHTSNSNCQFAFLYTNNAASDKSYFNYSSISRCVTENSATWYTLELIYGKICCPSVNISMNKCKYTSGIYCVPYKDSNSVTCSLTYSSFIDNVANGHTCIYISTAGSVQEIKYCNILRNTQGSLSSLGTFRTSGNLKIEDSCILENKADYIFYQGSSYTITVSSCTVDSTSNNGKLTIKNTVTKNFVLALNHMSTQNCNALYDSVGSLTAISPQSSQETIICYCTCRIIHYHAKISDFFTFICLFMFTFIHTKG